MRRLKPGLWVFAYGSLMWDPGFEPDARVEAVAVGWRRRFGLWSHHYRGTPDQPGLVLGLDRGGVCRGVAYWLRPSRARSVKAALWAREMISLAYRPVTIPVRTAAGVVPALTFALRPGHPQYAAGLGLAEQARIIAAAAGARGPNREYLENCLAYLAAAGVRDGDLIALGRQVAALSPDAPAPQTACGDAVGSP